MWPEPIGRLDSGSRLLTFHDDNSQLPYFSLSEAFIIIMALYYHHASSEYELTVDIRVPIQRMVGSIEAC